MTKRSDLTNEESEKINRFLTLVSDHFEKTVKIVAAHIEIDLIEAVGLSFYAATAVVMTHAKDKSLASQKRVLGELCENYLEIIKNAECIFEEI